MKFYKTIRDANKNLTLEYIDKAYLTACHGYSVIIFKEDYGWNITEIISGYTMKSGYKTLKAARADLDNMPKPEVVIACINRAIEYANSQGLRLPNQQ